MTSIIECDVEFYEGQIEEETARLARCTPDKEDWYKARIEACQAVVAALKEYAILLPHEPEARPRYVIADPAIGKGWPHIFSEYDRHNGRQVERERMTRFVFDTLENKLINLDVDFGGNWSLAEDDEIQDVADSLLNANNEALENPAAHGLVGSNELPAWFTPIKGYETPSPAM